MDLMREFMERWKGGSMEGWKGRRTQPSNLPVFQSSVSQSHAPQEVSEQNRLAKVVRFVAVLPIEPDVLDADVARIVCLVHHLEHASIINRVCLERRLQSPLATAAAMEVTGVF